MIGLGYKRCGNYFCSPMIMLSTQIIICTSLLTHIVHCWTCINNPYHNINRPKISHLGQKKIRYHNTRNQRSLEHAVYSMVQTDSMKSLENSVLSNLCNYSSDATQWAAQFGLEDDSGAIFYALFTSIRHSAKLGLRGLPFHMKETDIRSSVGDFLTTSNQLTGFFTFDDLRQALEEDFLDANRGIANSKREAWKLTTVSNPRGSSFEEARMTLSDVQTALDKGTVIFNAAGAHIPKLASATLACTDATSLPCAVNMYITEAGKRTSAPPHTDRQDVVVVQTQGKKSWKVFTPPDPSLRPMVDMFARGKVDDSLPLQALEDGSLGSEKLLDITLSPGDILFIPAGFPHTTDTINDLEPGKPETVSIHLTFNFETIVWHLDYLNLRRFALRKAGVDDPLLNHNGENPSPYVGDINSISKPLREELLQHIPLGILDENGGDLVESTTAELIRISQLVNPISFQMVPMNVWKDTVNKVRETGHRLFEIHRDMYLAAIEEGRQRKLERQMIAHLPKDSATRVTEWTPERIQRLNVFRVKKFYDSVDEELAKLNLWCSLGASSTGGNSSSLPIDWQYTSRLKAGDKVEADLGGAFFPATITKVNGDRFDVRFFDGDTMSGVERSMIKLLTPPKSEPLSDGTVSGFSKNQRKKKK